MTRRAGVVSGRIARLHAELVGIAGELLADPSHLGGDGYRSPEHWLAVHTGLPHALCRHLVRIARRSEELPATVRRLGEGAITVEQAGAIARHAPVWAEHNASSIAMGTSAGQFAKLMRRYSFEEPDTEAPADQAPEARAADDAEPAGVGAASLSMSMWPDRFRLTYEADPVTGALVEAAIREAKDALFTAGNAQASLADGLGEVASRSLGAVESPSRREHYRVLIHMDTTGQGWLHKRGALPPALLRRVTCDGRVRPVWHTEGRPVSVGRSQRIVPERTRRLVEDRDQGCRYPGCAASGFVENHHIDHWADGGATDMDRLVSLCPYHHDEHHRGAFSIAGTPSRPDGLVFRTRMGAVIARHHADPARDADQRAWYPSGWEPDRSFPRGETLHHRWVDLGRPPRPTATPPPTSAAGAAPDPGPAPRPRPAAPPEPAPPEPVPTGEPDNELLDKPPDNPPFDHPQRE